MTTSTAPAPLDVLRAVDSTPTGATALTVASRTGQPLGSTIGALLDLTEQDHVDRIPGTTPAEDRFALTTTGRLLLTAATGPIPVITTPNPIEGDTRPLGEQA